MNILILGGGGLIGHTLFMRFLDRFDNVHCTLRGKSARALFKCGHVYESVDVRDSTRIRELLDYVAPDVVLNCVGITKRKPEIEDMEQAIEINSLFPHRLARWASELGFRVIHFSTDCVFDGAVGNYHESSDTTGRDTYGKTKALGEIRYPHSLTIRSSFIGREISGKTEFLEWALSMRGQSVRGFDNAWYSGVSTLEMARVVGDIVEFHPNLCGLLQLATDKPVSKFGLLQHIDAAFGIGLQIERDSNFETQPTLDGTMLQKAMRLKLPDWPAMMSELAALTLYDRPESDSGFVLEAEEH